MPAAALAAAAARLSYSALRRRPPGGDATWSRTNHRGEPVTLLEGPAVAAGGVAGALLAPGLSARGRAAMLIAAGSAAALGGYDDLAGTGSSRGFRGHIGALRRGEVTTGAVKLAGIGVAGLAASAVLGASGARARPGRAADLVINAGLIAGGANLVNLFDLRPGRAIKVTLGSSALLAAAGPRARRAVAAPLGAAAALLPEDLAERAMLGDAGANALGAMLGTAAAAGLPRPARALTLAAVVGLTAASEKVSFTKVIARTPALNWLDMLGRRPAPAQASPRPAAASAADDQPVIFRNDNPTGTAAPAASASEPAAQAAAPDR
jgi:hypothetical protein